jgi:mono/diheme cytochrome c family protein
MCLPLSQISHRAALWAVVLAAAPSLISAEDGPIDFRRDVLPIFSEYCFECHGPDSGKRQAGLRLDKRNEALAELESGARAIVPRNPATSELLRRIRTTDDDVMPPPATGKQLSAEQKRVLEAWIAAEAPYAIHWAFESPQRPTLPAVRKPAWLQNPIDSFILARLESEGMQPALTADLRTLIRRVTLDLTGLPPTPDEVSRFLADDSPDAFEKVVDRLLASIHFGEHRARDWLDAARYADTHGYFTDHERFMWRWRDYVINAFNANLPFDQFTIEQLAGDLLPDATIEQRLASGFNRNHMMTEETGVIDEEYRVEYVADRVRTTAAVWMGLTVGCAQCHDHKFDPLSQREYYQLFAFFNQVPEKGIGGGKRNVQPILDLATSEEANRRTELRKAIAALDARLKPPAGTEDDNQAIGPRPGLADEERSRLEQERIALQSLERELLSRTTAMVMQEQAQPRQTFVLARGQYDQPREVVTPSVPEFLLPLPQSAPASRLGFAHWLVDPRHPLTTRVAVNRHWRQAFGEGLVRTVEDFGVRGEQPTHPELLDWLALEFVASGWDIKRLERTLIGSAAYRQASSVSPAQIAADPANRLWGRAYRARLAAETIRDSALAAAGLLATEVGGPSVRPYQPADLWKHITYDRKNTQSYEQSRGADLYRRSLYTYWKRQVPPPTMQLLDAPTRETCVLRRQRTNTPLQALALLNDVQFVEAARNLAARMLAAGQMDEKRIEHGFLLVTARLPSPREAAAVKKLLEAQRNEYQGAPNQAQELLSQGDSPLPANMSPRELAAWTVVGNLLLNLDEAICRE